jgi:hypothetical protein
MLLTQHKVDYDLMVDAIRGLFDFLRPSGYSALEQAALNYDYGRFMAGRDPAMPCPVYQPSAPLDELVKRYQQDKGQEGAGVGNDISTPISPMPPDGFKPFNKDNFRSNLARLTGQDLKGYDAHHVFPEARRDFFWKNYQLNIDDPRYGAWWKVSPNRSWQAYNSKWDDFFKVKRTIEEIYNFGRELAEDLGYAIYY